MKNFAITGVAGYVAPRHLKAIKDSGNRLVAAVDPHDSVGVLDNYFPEASFFTEFERFDRHLEKLRRSKASEKVDYLSICSPNFLHDAHIRLALRIGADAICEKPLVLNPWNLDVLSELEQEFGQKVYTILQLRVHASIIELKKKLTELNTQGKHNVSLTYITSRGLWYDYSWKGITEKSGGLATNIGVHFFDLLIWLFGNVKESYVHLYEPRRTAGFIELENADVKWYLSCEKSDLPEVVRKQSKPTYRSIQYDGKEIEFSDGFSDLHTKVYQQTLVGNGFGIEDARPSIKLVYDIRNSKVDSRQGELHPLATKILKT
ncbi:MAG: Gfo/Idh/MocA family oxidoreductase [Ignavibacteriaceae bacterium]